MIQSQKRLFVFLFIAVVSIGGFSIVIQNNVADKGQMEAGQSFRAALDTADQAMRSWLSENKTATKVWANLPEMRQSVEALLMSSDSQKALITSTAQANLHSWFKFLQQATGYQYYFIIGPENFSLALSRDQNVGAENLLFTQEKLFQMVWSAQTAARLLKESNGPLPDNNGQLREELSTMFEESPIFNEFGQVIAIFTFRLDPAEGFAAILQQGWIRLNGETYAFDDSGRLTSNSRFDEQLREVGLIAHGQRAIFNIDLRDPKVKGKTSAVHSEQQSLIRMAERAIVGKSGVDRDSYHNYLDVPVVSSTWLGDSKLRWGVTEPDFSEENQLLRTIKLAITSPAIIIILLLVAVITVFCVYRQRRCAESALHESDQYNRMLFNESVIGLALCRMNGELIDVNPAFAAILGRPVEEVLKLSYWDFTPEKYVAEEHAQLASLEKTGRYGPYEKEYIHASGYLVSVRLSGQILEKNGEKFIWSSVEDVTERKQAEEALRESERTLGAIFEQAAVGVALIESHSGKLLRMNKKYCEIVGYSCGELLSLDFMRITHPDDLQEDLGNLRLLLDGKIREYSMNKRYFRKDGSVVWVNLAVSAMWKTGDEPRNHIAVIENITERKRAEEKTLQLLQLNRELTQRLFRVQEEDRRHLARELHDELGHWLTAIHLNTETIKQLSEGRYRDIYENARAISKSVTEIFSDIRGMINLLRPALLDQLGLTESLKDLIKQWRAQCCDIDITLSLKGKLNDLNDDLNITIYRIIQESLTNAAKYAKACDIAIQLIRQPGETKAQDSLLLTIEDNGEGINASLATEGIGLHSLRERVLAIGGNFAIKSTRGEGVRIEVQLPVNFVFRERRRDARNIDRKLSA